ncbi:HD domain-containing protein [Edaphobacter sp. HDX4]|uniref:HD domain-containing phosphohydrolase n=1 Tax=Edaphobacter sp. HDX4 TaxID=2794064 RepID=UPI002FE5530E
MGETSASFCKLIPESGESISLSEIISALSFAIELTDGAVHGHALRTCVLGMRIAVEAGFTSEQKASLYYALLLKDVGNEEVLGLRCDRGASIVSKLGMGSLAADAVNNLEEHWDGSGTPHGLCGGEIPKLARVAAVAQHLDMFSIGRNSRVAIETLEEWSGRLFDPELVDAAVALHRRGVLWEGCRGEDDPQATRAAVLALDPNKKHRLDEDQIDRICEAFAEIVDAKSHFTFRHSIGVAELARGIAEYLHLPPHRVRLVWRAALLHDLGKLSISNKILDKKTQLTDREWNIVRQHPGLTRQILEQIAPFREIAVVAGEHHEKLDGSGYPNRLSACDLAIESRIIAVADVYGALSEDRPYRPGLSFAEILPILNDLSGRKLDESCIGALLSYLSDHTPIDVSAEVGARRITRFCA